MSQNKNAKVQMERTNGPTAEKLDENGEKTSEHFRQQ